ncbi:MAG: YdeI/OmpD-associated family protein [Planctomycetota bacterium]
MDGRRKKLNAERTMQYVSPKRTPYWSKTYKDRVARLTRAGRMHPAGLAAVAAARRSGAWTFFDDVDALVVPDDLAAALAAHPPASDRFAGFPPGVRRDALRWIKLAKTPRTRAQRVAETAARAAAGTAASGTR